MAIRAHLASRKFQLIARYVQAAVAIAFLVLVAWSNKNRGFWMKDEMTGPLALGSITFAVTLVLLVYQVFCLHRDVLAMGGKWVARLPVEILLVLLWGGSAGLMAKDKGHDPASDRWWRSPPTVEWGLGIAFGWLEFLLFIITAVMVYMASRASTRATGASYV